MKLLAYSVAPLIFGLWLPFAHPWPLDWNKAVQTAQTDFGPVLEVILPFNTPAPAWTEEDAEEAISNFAPEENVKPLEARTDSNFNVQI